LQEIVILWIYSGYMKVRNRSDLEKHFINKLNAKRFFKNILKNSKKQTTFRRYTTPLSSQNDKSETRIYNDVKQ